MAGIIGKKIGMTSFYNENRKSVACTLIETLPNVVTQLKEFGSDKYESVQLAYGEKKEKNTTKALKGHFQKAGTSPKSLLVEFRNFDANVRSNLSLGSELKAEDVFNENDYVDVVGKSKGKGFQGVVKRHGFGGVGQSTHGQHNRLRAPGAIGACSTPSRVFKGLKMAGRMGQDRVKVLNLKIVKIFKDCNVLAVSGPIPGAKGSYVFIEK